ncbi:uncharacterized protein PRCAT00002974001 [Priceomyces carsonii]|uniref:uncharacterized protein n=1 Tax=Priceomyces carsonii TaxID=28549 RepID=UPI002ED94CC5|nr:unnamed protein product [Priceomyces carsonii]
MNIRNDRLNESISPNSIDCLNESRLSFKATTSYKRELESIITREPIMLSKASEVNKVVGKGSKFDQSKMVSRFRLNREQIPQNAITDNSITSCVRCRRLKKKCDKYLPNCIKCQRAGEKCEYAARKTRKRQNSVTKELPTIDDLHLSESVVALTSTSADQTPYSESQSSQIGEKRIQEVRLPLDPEVARLSAKHSNLTPSLTNIPLNLKLPSFSSYSKQISNVLISAVGINTNSNVSLIPPIIDKALIWMFIEAYFEHNHRAYPIIDKSEFTRKLKEISMNDLDAFEDQFELYMVMAIGCTSLERAGLISRDKKIAEYFASKALNVISNNLSGNDIKNVKYLLLLGLYSYFDPSEFTSWEISGKLTRLSVSLGLNKELLSLSKSKISAQEIEMRRRLFWSVYIMDKVISVSLGRPVGINDEDINIPLPAVLGNEPDENEDIEINKLIIEIRRIEGRILKKVHSVNSGIMLDEKGSREDRCKSILQELKYEIEDWYLKAGSTSNPLIYSDTTFSFHGSVPWYDARYSHLLILLYRPSYLNPTPTPDILEVLGRACLQTLSSTYRLYSSNLLPLNWITLYRFLTVCTTMLYCLCKWSIDLIESKTEIGYCIEILEGFGNDWTVARKCAEVFKSIDNKMLEISLTSEGNVPDMDHLINDLLGASSSYHEILSTFSVDISLDGSFMYVG